jgi:hypothetical protein
MTADGMVTETWASTGTRTWTVAATATDGMACIAKAGADFDLTHDRHGVDG